MSVDTEPVRARPSFCPRESPRYESRARPPRLPPPGRGAGTNFGYPRPLRGGVVVVADAPSFPPLPRCQTSSAAPPSAGVPESAAAQPPAPPPPPYESVVLEDPPAPAHPAPASSSPAPPSPSPSPSGDITVEVTAPVKVGEGMSAYAAYGVTVQTTLPSFASETSNVTRRFSDFTWLRAKLQSSHPGVILHPLPEKTVTTNPFNPEFLEVRRAGLDHFMRKTCAHPTLRHSPDLRAFLQSQDAQSVGASAAAWYQRGAAGTALGAVDSWWQSVSTAAESFVAGAGVETMMMEEDPAYLEATEYLLLMEERLRRASKSADDVVHAVNTSGLIVGNFGDNAHILGDCEEKGAKTLLGAEAGGLGQAFRQVGAAATSLRAPAERDARALADSFRAPLKRGLELVQAAKEAIDARADALLKLQTARSKCEQRRVKLEAALANPAPAAPAPAPTNGGGWFDTLASVTKLASSAPPTVEEMQKDSEAAAEARREAQERYDAIKATMKTELPRVHADLEADLNAAFASAAQIFANLAAAQAEAWENVMPGCSQVAPLEVPPLPKATDKDSLVSQAWSTVMRGGANGAAEGATATTKNVDADAAPGEASVVAASE